MTKAFKRLNIAAVTQEVFDSWETKKQKEYLDQHPNSKFAKQNGKTGQPKVEPKKQPLNLPKNEAKDYKEFNKLLDTDKEFFDDFIYDFDDADYKDIDEVMYDAYNNAKERLYDKDTFDPKKSREYYKKLKHYDEFIRNNEEYFRKKALEEFGPAPIHRNKYF